MPTASRHPDTALAVFLAFLKLGCSAFGGPIAHLGYFRDEFVRRRGWLSESSYADLVALCQFLPGPASSQVGMALGLARAGYPGALAAWLGFTLPSALLLVLFALGLGRWGALLPEGVLHGLKIAAVAVVAQAVWGMGRSLCPDRPRLTLMALSCASVLAWPTAWTQVAVIAGAGLAGLALLKTEAVEGHERLPIAIGYRGALLFLTLFAVLLVCLPLAARLWPEHWLRLLDAFYRAGSLVFGGGHVVLPLLQAEVVPKGWVDGDTFLAGYAAAQAVPGPLFTFAAFLGAASARRRTAGAARCCACWRSSCRRSCWSPVPCHSGNACATNAGYGQRWPGQRGGGRPAAGGAVPAALDRRHPAPGRLRPAALRPAGPARLEDAALASGARLRRGRRPDRHSRLAVQGQAQPLRRRRGRLARLRALRPVAEAQAAPVLAVDEDRHRKIVHQLAGVTGVGL